MTEQSEQANESNMPIMKNRNFFLLFQGAMTSSVAATLYSFAISFYILDVTENDASIQGTYLFVCGLVYVLVSFVGGVLADRWDKAKIIYGSDFIKGILILSSFVLLRIFIRQEMTAPQLALLFLIGIVNNVLAAIFTPASTALIPEIVPSEQLMKANSLFSIQNTLVSMLGIILAALFYSMLSITALFLMIGVLYMISGVTELFIRVAHTRKEESLTLRIVLRDFREGLKYLWELKPVFYIIVGAVFLNFFVTPLPSNLLPYLIKTDIAGSDYMFQNVLAPESWSAVFSMLLGIGSVIMSIIMGSRKESGSTGKKIKFWLAVMALLLFGIAISYTLTAKQNINLFLIAILVGMFLMGFALVGVNLPLNVVIQRDVQKGMLAKVTSIMTIGSQGLTPFASLIAGILLSRYNAQTLIFFCACGLALTTIFVCASKNISKL